jgi:thiosulfate/3-mercaptopyruvate sulfurtransferase
MYKLLIRRDMNIVVYDNMGLFSAPRALWMLKYFGADRVRVLNGGFKKWVAEGRPIVEGVDQERDPYYDFENGEEGDPEPSYDYP